MRGDAQALRQLFHFAKPLGFRHRFSGDIAHRDIATLGDQLARELAAHACAASGDDGGFSGKFLHGISPTLLPTMSGSRPRARDLAAAHTTADSVTLAAQRKSARLQLCSRSAARRSGEPNAKNRSQSLDGGCDDWTPLEKACRLDAGDRHIFDDCYAFSRRSLCIAG
jgi:hypothetical protein